MVCMGDKTGCHVSVKVCDSGLFIVPLFVWTWLKFHCIYNCDLIL